MIGKMFLEKKAFTLIELIVVIATISILMGQAIASYTNYSQTVRLEMATKKFTDSLYLARKKARAADASQCSTGETVSLYEVTKTNQTDYEIFPLCLPSLIKGTSIKKSLDNGVVFKTFPSTPLIEFKTVVGSSLSSSVCIILDLNNSCRYVSVSTRGIITNGKLNNCSDPCP